MSLDPKILIAGAIASFFLFGSKKKPASTAITPGSGTDSNKDDGKGDVGEPAGPNGCKLGLTEVDGICVDPKNPPKKADNNNGGGGSKPAASELIIAKDCKSFQFGDKTGDSWWKNKGLKSAKQWVESGELDPLNIAFQMIKKTGNCFKTFPERVDFENWFEFNQAKYDWINKNRPIWALLYSIRDRVDISQFNGIETVTADPTKFDLGLKFGKAFDYDKFWEMLKPIAITLLQEEASVPGSILGVKSDDSMRTYNVVIALFTIIFPNVPFANLQYGSKKTVPLHELELFQKLQESVDEYDGQSIDLENEGF